MAGSARVGAWLSRRRAALGRRGSVALLSAASMLSLIAATATAFDFADAYLIRTSDQRIADQSAIGAAFAYAQSGSTPTAQAASASLAVANGAGGASVSTSIVSSPSGDGNLAAKVVVTTQMPLSGFGRMTAGSGNGGFSSLGIAATAYAEIHAGTPCIIALLTAGVAATGGVSATATSCSIASNGNVSASSGAKITAQAVYAVGSISATNGASITTSPNAGQIFPASSKQADPYANAGVFSRLPTVAAMTAPNFPSVGTAPSGGTAMSCNGTLTVAAGSHGTISTSAYPSCSSISFSGGGETDIAGSGIQIGGGSVTLNFAAGTYKIDGLNTGSYGTTTVNLTGNPTLYVWNGITTAGGSALTINGSGTYYVQGGIRNAGAGALTITNTNAATPSAFTVAGGITVSNGSASFPAGTYIVTSGDGTAGIDVSGGDKASFGNGSFQIAQGITIGGGASLSIGAALTGSSVFQIPTTGSAGDAILTGGGSTLSLGSFTNFDLNGPMVLQSTLTLGTGAYTINGAVNVSSSGGGSVTGNNVSIVAAGPISFGAGFSTVSLTAPASITSATEGTAPTIVLASQSSSASVVTAGASNTMVVGGLYTPAAALQLAGAGTLTGGGNCLQIIAGSISLGGGSAISTNCSALAASGGAGSVALVQ